MYETQTFKIEDSHDYDINNANYSDNDNSYDISGYPVRTVSTDTDYQHPGTQISGYTDKKIDVGNIQELFDTEIHGNKIVDFNIDMDMDINMDKLNEYNDFSSDENSLPSDDDHFGNTLDYDSVVNENEGSNDENDEGDEWIINEDRIKFNPDFDFDKYSNSDENISTNLFGNVLSSSIINIKNWKNEKNNVHDSIFGLKSFSNLMSNHESLLPHEPYEMKNRYICMYIYVCVCACMCVCIYADTYMYLCIYVYI
jgi:hypothetical protein